MKERLRLSITAALALVLLLPALAVAQGEPTEPGEQAAYELSLTMSAAPEQPVMGEAFDLHLQVSNAGPEAAADAGLYLGLPEEVELTTFVADPSLDCHEVTYDDPYPGADPPSAGEGDGSTYPVYGGTSFECSAATLAPGSSSGVTLSLIRRAARPVFLYSSVYGSGSESNYEDNYAEIEIAPDADHAADVSVFMTTPHEVAIGATFDFAMTIENSGPTAAQDVVLFDPIPYGIDDISVTPSENCEIVEQNYGTEEDPYIYRELNCALGTLQPGETTEVRLTSTRTSAWEIYNDAWVTTTSYDTEYANDYAFASLPADPSVTSDLHLTVAEPSQAPLLGDEFDLVFSVSNEGPSAAGDVVVNDFLPEGLEFVGGDERCRYEDYSYKEPMPYAPDAGTPPSIENGATESPIFFGGAFLACEPGLIQPDEEVSMSVTLRRTRAWELWNGVSVYASNFDPNWENNYAELHIDPDKTHEADISVQMTGPEDAAVGETFDYTITVTNNGPSAAPEVWLDDALPFGVDVSSVEPAEDCTLTEYPGYAEPQPGDAMPSFYGYREVRCGLGEMAAGEARTVTIEATRTSEWELWNSAWVSTSAYDANWDNDYADHALPGDDPWGSCVTGEGTSGDDPIVVGDCDVDSGTGADNVTVQPSSDAGAHDIRTGKGDDSVSLLVASGSSGQRTFSIATGQGDDHISIVVGPSGQGARIFIEAGAGDDSIDIDAAPSVTDLRIVIHGGDGNDEVRAIRYLSGKVRSKIKLFGGPGRDRLIAGEGDDLLMGGRGRDAIDGGAGDDFMRGGLGRDTCGGGPGADDVYC